MVNLSQPMTIQTALAAYDAVENRTNLGQSNSASDSPKQASKSKSRPPSSSSKNVSKISDFDIDDEGGLCHTTSLLPLTH